MVSLELFGESGGCVVGPGELRVADEALSEVFRDEV